eukprot:136858-Rhodomonas_salina.1
MGEGGFIGRRDSWEDGRKERERERGRSREREIKDTLNLGQYAAFSNGKATVPSPQHITCTEQTLIGTMGLGSLHGGGLCAEQHRAAQCGAVEAVVDAVKAFGGVDKIQQVPARGREGEVGGRAVSYTHLRAHETEADL